MNLPIRIRLTAWYAALMAGVILVLGGFVVVQLRNDLHQQVDDELRAVSDTLVHAVEVESADNPASRPLSATENAEDFADAAQAALPHSAAAAQVVDADGHVVLRYGPAAEGARLADATTLATARASGAQTFTDSVGEESRHYRVRVAPFVVHGQPFVMVVAETLRPVEDAVQRALLLLMVAGPIAIAGTALIAYWLASKALRPVGQMTSDAEEIGAGRLDGRVAVPPARDELGRLARTLNAMLERIERGVAEKHRLVADASHELRTPLAVMRAEIQVSLRADDLSTAAREVLESTRDEVEEMGRTVDNLITLAEVDEGRLELLTRAVGLRQALEQASGSLTPLAAAKNVTFEISGDSLDAQADVQRLNQALTNLLENAVKFSPPGSTVRAETWRHADEVGVSISDEGPGVPEEDRDHLFDRFYRVETARGRGIKGSGLGLAICREVAEAHGGRVWVDSTPSRGSTFNLALPGWRSVAPPLHGGADHP